MKTVVIANPKARAGRVERYWSRWHRLLQEVLGQHEVHFTKVSGEGTPLARQAILAGAERIVVVGGDGTINEVVNGFIDPTSEKPYNDVQLMVVPVGTGGDFARSIGFQKGGDLETLLADATPHLIDIGRAEMTSNEGPTLVRHFINISSFGSSGLIVDMVNHSNKMFGARLSFFWGTLKGLVAYRNQPVRLQVDDTFDEEMSINTVAVSNGRFFGGSMKIAPTALLDDGLFDVIVVGNIRLPTFIGYAPKLYRGTHLGVDEKVIKRVTGRQVVVTPLSSTAKVRIDIDGEQPGVLPVRYDILPKAISLVAPWHRAEGLIPATKEVGPASHAAEE